MMKKNISKIVFITLALFCSISILNANDDLVNEDLKKLKEQAIKVYKSKDYEKSYELFSKLYLSALGDGKVNFLLGRSAYEIGKFEIALASFERVQVLEPYNSRNELELGRTQYRLEMYEDARISFKKVLNNPNLPDVVRKNIELFLVKIEDKLNNLFYTVNARAGVLYDSNVNYGNDDLSNTSSEANGSFATEFQASFSSIYDIGEKDGIELKYQALLYHKEYVESEAKENNITYLSLAPGLIYQDLYTIYELNLMLDKMYSNGDDYLTALSAMPMLTYKLDPRTSLITSLKYTDKAFHKTGDSYKDSRNYEFNLIYQKILADSYYSIKPFFTVENNKNGEDYRVDNISYGLSLNYNKQISSSYILGLSSTIRTKKYSVLAPSILATTDPDFSKKRKDDSYNIGINLSKRLSTNLQVDGKFDYERVFSNQTPYSYEKSSLGLYLNYAF